MKRRTRFLLALALVFALVLSGCSGAPSQAATDLSGVSISQFRSESPWTELNGNVPEFDASELTRTDPFETYSDLDSLGRCGVAYANICMELMPTQERSMTAWTASISTTAVISLAFSWQAKTPTRRISSPAPGT